MDKQKKKLEWSKLLTFAVVSFFAIYGVWSGIEYYTLCRLAIEENSTMPDATLAVTCVTTILASLVSYCLYNFGLKNSLNKNHLTIDDVTGFISPINKSELSETLDNIAMYDKESEG